MSLARISAAGLALVVCAWFALGLLQTQDVERAKQILSGPAPLGSAEGRRAASLLSSAGTLNPASEVDIQRARLASLQHDRRRAERILLDVARREPMNVEPWAWLARLAYGDGPTIALALNHIAQLVPRVPPAP